MPATFAQETFDLFKPPPPTPPRLFDPYNCGGCGKRVTSYHHEMYDGHERRASEAHGRGLGPECSGMYLTANHLLHTIREVAEWARNGETNYCGANKCRNKCTQLEHALFRADYEWERILTRWPEDRLEALRAHYIEGAKSLGVLEHFQHLLAPQ